MLSRATVSSPCEARRKKLTTLAPPVSAYPHSDGPGAIARGYQPRPARSQSLAATATAVHLQMNVCLHVH